MKRESIESISFDSVSFSSRNGAAVFSDFSLDLPMNKIVWLRGVSGTGKSVLIKMICGLLMPTKGQVLVNGQAISEMTFEEFTPMRCNMGYSFDFGGLINNRTLVANLLLANQYHNFEIANPEEIVSRINEYMRIFNIDKFSQERPSSVVGGLRKATCVARAFVHEPELLLLDDPTTGLQGEVRDRLAELIINKKNAGRLQHVFVASDDDQFMKKLNPILIDMGSVQKITKEQTRAA
ncbi:MAG: ATP-binding cassette domain-containing protein [Bdellovibrionales bacterium]|nr:ATP-binding cassette domain-containing protein [Bdellovibrionales bacterium]